MHPAAFLLAGDQGENLLGKGDDNAARHGEHAIGALGGIVALEGQAYLQNTEAQQDEANGADQREEKSRVSAQRLTALLRQVSKRSPPNRTYTSLRIRLSRNQSNLPACNRSWQDMHSAIVFRLRPIMARSHAALPFRFLSFLT